MKTTQLQKISFLVLRVLSSLIFITAGLNHLFWQAEVAVRLTRAELGYLATSIAPAETLIVVSGIGLLLGGLFLLTGYKTKLAALLLLTILIPITITIQLANPTGMGPLFKNIALMGMLLFFSINGALYYGLDQLLLLNRKARRKSSLTSVNYVALTAGMVMLLSACATSGTSVQKATGRQEAEAGQKNYAVLISQPNHLKAAVHTSETIGMNSPYHRNNFVVMACGKSVEAFVKGNPMEGEFHKGQKNGVTFKVCGLSLKQFNINAATLVEGVEVVPNGLTYMFELQQQGYYTVEL